MVLFCQKCGSKMVADDSVFCSKCGVKISVTNNPQQYDENSTTQLTYDEAIDYFKRIVLAAFQDLEKIDELTIIKYFIKMCENDLKNTSGYSRANRSGRIAILQGGLKELEFDISDKTIEYLYDSIISDMDLKKIPNHSVVEDNFSVTVKKDDEGKIFYEILCPACDESIRFKITEQSLYTNENFKIICPYCSYKAEISKSAIHKRNKFNS